MAEVSAFKIFHTNATAKIDMKTKFQEPQLRKNKICINCKLYIICWLFNVQCNRTLFKVIVKILLCKYVEAICHGWDGLRKS